LTRFLRHPLLLLFLLSVLAYGLLIPFLGFYWDDLPMSWIRYELGPQAMVRYFSNNRPLWGVLYQLTTRLIPQVPLYWQLFALFWRWVTAALFWLLLRRLWPSREEMAFWASAFFLLYPGFNQQWVAYLYSHFFIVLSLFLFSLWAMLRALESAAPSSRWHGVALLASALNLWMMEYFFFLELVRPFLLWVFLGVHEEKPAARLSRLLKVFWPYGMLWGAAVLWRMFVFNNQVYQTRLLDQLRSDFWPTLGGLLLTILTDVREVLVDGWLQVFLLPRPEVDGWRTTGMYAAVVALSAVTVAFFVWKRRTQEMPSAAPLGIGLVALFLAGWPFWLAELEISLNFPASRFTLPFLFGSALFLSGALSYVRREPFRWGLAILVIALAVGRQFLWADLYRRDWRVHRTMFWQLSWRAPSLTPNTMLLLNEGAFFAYADNSLAAALNWIYAPDLKGEAIPYILFYPTNRIGNSLPALAPGQSVRYSFLAGTFQGSTSQVVAFYFQPPACLRFLDPEIEHENRMIPIESLMREALLLSDARWIGTQEAARLPAIYGPEPSHGWCYYFQKADLARQQKHWAQVAKLAEQAFDLQDHPNDPLEYFPFIEAYAHLGDWSQALKLSRQAYQVSPRFVGPPLCRLWERLKREVSIPDTVRDDIHNHLGCFAE
jgi:hypothetical protein